MEEPIGRFKGTSRGPILNAMTVDVEEYFQVSAFEGVVDAGSWSTRPARVETAIDRILGLFDEHDTHATFFVLGWIAEQHPEMVRRIAKEGHEIASHGWNHTRVTEQNPESFFQDVFKTRNFLEDLSGVKVSGYRAASYSINESNTWAWEKLVEAGYVYSSSVVPVKHDLYGMPSASRSAFFVADGQLLEIPVTTISIAGRNINCGGGGWFRLFPYAFSRWALRRVNETEGQAGLFYFHPWEIDPEQPRLSGLPLKSKFRHYLNLQKNYEQIERLFNDFQWGRMDDVFLGAGPN